MRDHRASQYAGDKRLKPACRHTAALGAHGICADCKNKAPVRFYGEGRHQVMCPEKLPMPSTTLGRGIAQAGVIFTSALAGGVVTVGSVVPVILAFPISIAFAVLALFIWVVYETIPTYRSALVEREKVRVHNFDLVEDFFSAHDVLELVKQSDALTERDEKWATDYELHMARQGKAVDGSELLDPRLSAKTARAVLEGLRDRITQAHAVPTHITAESLTPSARRLARNGYPDKPTLTEHDFHCDDPAGPCTCSDNAPNCRCNVCENRSLDPYGYLDV